MMLKVKIRRRIGGTMAEIHAHAAIMQWITIYAAGDVQNVLRRKR